MDSPEVFVVVMAWAGVLLAVYTGIAATRWVRSQHGKTLGSMFGGGLGVLVVATVLAFTGSYYQSASPAAPADPVPTGTPPTAFPRPIADVGTSEPNELFEYRPDPRSPAFCREPDLMLEKLKAAIESGSTAGTPGSCVANIRPQEFGSSGELHIACRLAEVQGCADVYVARVWGERSTDAIGRYVLRGFGWVRRSCQRGTYDVPGSRQASRGTSDTLNEVFIQCR